LGSVLLRKRREPGLQDLHEIGGDFVLRDDAGSDRGDGRQVAMAFVVPGPKGTARPLVKRVNRLAKLVWSELASAPSTKLLLKLGQCGSELAFVGERHDPAKLALLCLRKIVGPTHSVTFVCPTDHGFSCESPR
jgi:hypothetical protein